MMAARNQDQLRAQSKSAGGWHRGSNAKPSGWIGAGRDDTPFPWPAADGERFSPQFWMPILLDGTEESIQIEVQNPANHGRFLPWTESKVVIFAIEELSGKRYITDGA
jgi:hypothetical protein